MNPFFKTNKMAGRDRTASNSMHSQTFLPAKLPDGIKRMVPIVLKLKKESFRNILQGKFFFQKAVF